MCSSEGSYASEGSEEEAFQQCINLDAQKQGPGLGREGTQTYSKSSELSTGSVASSETTYKESDFTTG